MTGQARDEEEESKQQQCDVQSANIYRVLLSGGIVERQSSVSSPNTFLNIHDQCLKEANEVFFVSHLLEVSILLIADKHEHIVQRNMYTNLLKFVKNQIYIPSYQHAK